MNMLPNCVVINIYYKPCVIFIYAKKLDSFNYYTSHLIYHTAIFDSATIHIERKIYLPCGAYSDTTAISFYFEIHSDF